MFLASVALEQWLNWMEQPSETSFNIVINAFAQKGDAFKAHVPHVLPWLAQMYPLSDIQKSSTCCSPNAVSDIQRQQVLIYADAFRNPECTKHSEKVLPMAEQLSNPSHPRTSCTCMPFWNPPGRPPPSRGASGSGTKSRPSGLQWHNGAQTWRIIWASHGSTWGRFRNPTPPPTTKFHTSKFHTSTVKSIIVYEAFLQAKRQ